MIGNRRQIDEIRQWLASWRRGGLIISGPTGCGKSAAARLAAKEAGYELIESSASDVRGRSEFEDLLRESQQSSVFAKKNAILIEDPEIIESKSALLRLVKESQRPVIITAENPYDLNMAALCRTCRAVRFGKVDNIALSIFLRQVCAKEKISTEHVSAIVAAAHGDVRAALIDLEAAVANREHASNIFETVQAAFRGDRQRIADSDLHELMFWISENMGHAFRGAELAAAYDKLSKADVFAARIIRRQSWNMQKYVIDCIAGMGHAARLQPRPPRRTKRPNRATMLKIAAATHVRAARATEYIDIIASLLDEKFCAEMGFDEDDIDFLHASAGKRNVRENIPDVDVLT